jgi:hypothetical protein
MLKAKDLPACPDRDTMPVISRKQGHVFWSCRKSLSGMQVQMTDHSAIYRQQGFPGIEGHTPFYDKILKMARL